MPFERKLNIPRELYFNNMPHTLKIWPSIFQGNAIDIDLKKVKDAIYEKDTIDYKLRQFLIKIGIKKILQTAKVDYRKAVPKTVGRRWRAYPSSFGLDTILDHYDSISWNIPGLDPEYIVGYPSLDSMVPYVKREYSNWKHITLGMCLKPLRLNVAYTHIIDGLSHREQPLDPFYLDIANHVKMLRKLSDIEIMLVSDHGATADGRHTDYAYLGCTRPVYSDTVLDVRKDMERILEAGPGDD